MSCPICGSEYDSLGVEVGDNFCDDCRKEARYVLSQAVYAMEGLFPDDVMTDDYTDELIIELLNEELMDM